MTEALAIYQEFDNIQRAALALYESKYFSDANSKAQAIVKVMAGAELGLPPFASMTGIHIIQGKPALGSNVIATLVKNDPRYDYHVKECTDKTCILAWFEGGRGVGSSSFTMDEAKQAGLTKNPSWQKYPSDMLFARAISRGARRFAPGIFGGSPVYTPEELGADEDEEGHIIDAPVKVIDQTDDTKVAADLTDLGITEPDTETNMPLEFAEDETGSDGVRYGDKETSVLVNMANAIQKKMEGNGYTDDDLETYTRKLTAIRTILKARA